MGRIVIDTEGRVAKLAAQGRRFPNRFSFFHFSNESVIIVCHMIKNYLKGISYLLSSSLSKDLTYSLHRFGGRPFLLSSSPLRSAVGEA
jgi:hypothetical protein